jgi:hypothetical protein
MLPQEVDQPPPEQIAHPLTLGLAREVLAPPGLRVVDVLVLGGDVEVPQDEQRLRRIEARAKPRVQGVEPGELDHVRGIPDGLSVHGIQVHEAQASRGRAQHPRFARDWVGGEPSLDAGELGAREDRDSVVGPLAEAREVVAERLDGGPREPVVIDLRLLQTHDVGRPPAQQRLKPALASADGVHVPGDDPHGHPR